jgi:8-oxo-dGTP diphosphatase
MTLPTRIAIAVVEHDERFLVGERGAGTVLAGLAEFPGGKIEAGETPAAAAVRECREEAGLEIEVLGEYPRHTESYDHGQVELYFFACRPLGDVPAPRPPYRWVGRRDLRELDFPRGNRALLQLLTGRQEPHAK